MSSEPKQLVAILTAEDFLLEWQPSKKAIGESSERMQSECFRRYHQEDSDWLFILGLSPADLELDASLQFWRNFAATFCQRLALTPELETLRHHAEVPADPALFKELLALSPALPGIEHLSLDRLQSLWRELNTCYARLIKAHEGSVADFLHTYSPDLQLAGRVFFHMVENKAGDAPFAFLATYSSQAQANEAVKHVPLKFALKEFKEDPDRLVDLLATVYKAAGKSSLISTLIDSGELFHPLAWGNREAFEFLHEVALYESSGICCRIPNWWTSKPASVNVAVTMEDNKAKSYVGLDSLLRGRPHLEVGGEKISLKEARELLEQAQGLALIKNKWVAVDHEKLKAALEALDSVQGLLAAGVSLRDALRYSIHGFSGHSVLADAPIDIEIHYGEKLQESLEQLNQPELSRDREAAADFSATLRPYQQSGLNWLALLDSLQLGGCLADDMGLGKTIQVLAFLSTLRDRALPSLLVVPASLMANWQSEIQRFLPQLKVLLAHPSVIGKQAREGLEEKERLGYHLIITTYGMVQRAEWLRQTDWEYVILDEAQAIKNPGTKQTRSIKELKSRNRIAMTGTPVENKLGDLWSLFDFLNPGLLGNHKQFTSFSKQLQKDPTGYARLRRVTSPYILRRLKTDKSIISDLPDKIEMKTYAELSKAQTVLYRNLVEELEKELKESEGIQRKGMVLSALMNFKQLCNHPDQHLGLKDYAENKSGKFIRLREICETIREKRERVLVFTQFKEMCDPLNKFLSEIFEKEGLVLHGSIPVKKRRGLVEQFQGRDYVPFMVLSIKAGGVGLNLTKANHVIHFDRWWNPAVENQATDRAFRIGQEKHVLVHKFITKGSVEERIDQMIEDKLKLSEEIIGSAGADAGITEMGNEEILNLFRLQF